MRTAQALTGLALTAVALAGCADGAAASAPSAASSSPAAPTSPTTTAAAAPSQSALTTLIPESIAAEADKTNGLEGLTVVDIGYLGSLLDAGFEWPSPEEQARRIKIGEAVCARLDEGFTLSEILATASSPGDRQSLEVMADVAQQTYCVA